MVRLRNVHEIVGINRYRHIIIEKPIIYDVKQTQSENNKADKVSQEKIFLTSYIDNILENHPVLDKIFQLFLRYLVGWFSIVDYYLE